MTKTLKELRDILQKEADLYAILKRYPDEIAEAYLAKRDLEDLHAENPDLSTYQDEEGVKFDFTSLPVFGGEAPDDTQEVWSWDETHLLTGSVSDIGGLKLVERCSR